ncbi:MAG: tetratricopeptide repeat protein [Xanthomonadaceae bacterium]|nr:tetratricopeptide repeat protein [Xanthomonadaceae bacterium]
MRWRVQPVFPRPLLSRLSAMLAVRTGLHFPEERWGDLEKGIAAAAPVFGMPDAPSCARWLLDTSLTRDQIGVLASHLIVGETYFFRDERCFEILEQHVLPERLQARADVPRPLRVWSAGCCTGEEPYSIAMLVDRLLPHGVQCGATILATDINPAFLRKAAQGVYGEWSFRTTPAWLRERYFAPAKNSRFEIRQPIRQRVRFSCLNLADDSYPSPANDTDAMDVIFCRNVLMYLTAAQAKKVVEKLRRALVDGGWLIVGPAETSISLFARFAPVEFAGAVFYRKIARTPLPAAALPPQPPAADAAPAIARRMAPPDPDRAQAQAGEAAACGKIAGEALLRMARACANRGKLAEAAQWCEKAVAADRLDPASQYLLATIRLEQGQSDAAVQSLLRTLYLDPDFVLAHFALGSVCLSQSRHREAQRHFDNALTLLRAHPYDEPLPESERLTAGRLAQIIGSLRASLPRTATGAQQEQA